jgi:hypothetical protein
VRASHPSGALAFTGAGSGHTSRAVSQRSVEIVTKVRLSELFAPGKDSLVIYNFMFPRTYGGDRPGPSSGQTALTYNRDYFGETADGVAGADAVHLNLLSGSCE